MAIRLAFDGDKLWSVHGQFVATVCHELAMCCHDVSCGSSLWHLVAGVWPMCDTIWPRIGHDLPCIQQPCMSATLRRRSFVIVWHLVAMSRSRIDHLVSGLSTCSPVSGLSCATGWFRLVARWRLGAHSWQLSGTGCRVMATLCSCCAPACGIAHPPWRPMVPLCHRAAVVCCVLVTCCRSTVRPFSPCRRSASVSVSGTGWPPDVTSGPRTGLDLTLYCLLSLTKRLSSCRMNTQTRHRNARTRAGGR